MAVGFQPATEQAALIQWQGVSKRLGERQVLDGVSLRVAAGETVAIIGPSGGGKSTLLRCANLLRAFDAGEIQVGPHRVRAQESGPDRSAARDVRRVVGMVFQDFQLFPHRRAWENVALGPQQVLGLPAGAARDRAHALLDRVGLAERATAYPHQLSGGQQQRVAIARALALEPRALLCDEITSALDPELKQEVLEVLAALRRDGTALVLVTHEIGFARRAADRVVMFEAGRVVEEGPPQQVLHTPRTERLREFLRYAEG